MILRATEKIDSIIEVLVVLQYTPCNEVKGLTPNIHFYDGAKHNLGIRSSGPPNEKRVNELDHPILEWLSL
jgi:hypothetical protein